MKIMPAELSAICILAALCAVIISSAHHLTRERIAENIRMKKLHTIIDVMKAELDNDIYADVKDINYTNERGEEFSTSAYRARKSGRPVGIVLNPVLANGYNGEIQMSVGILYDGTLSGIKVLNHQETEKLGSRVHQDESDWLDNFSRQSLARTPAGQWAIKSESGKFDQLSGATITSRGVIEAVKDSLLLYDEHKDNIFSD